MATKQEFLELLESLEKSEKQIITLERSKKKTNPNYFILYDWIEKNLKGQLKTYDKTKVLVGIGNGWKASTLRTAEQSLYEKILEILSFKHLGKSTITKLNQFLAEANILKNKGFYDGSLTYLEKAADIAYTYHKHALLMEIIPRIIDVILLTKYEGRKEKVQQLSQQLKTATRIVKQEAEYRSLNVNLLIQYQESRNPADIPNLLKEDYHTLINKKFPTSGSFYAQYYFHSIKAIWNNLQKQTDLAYENQKKVVELWQKPKAIKKENVQSYLTQLANLINYAVTDRNFSGARAAIILMEQVEITTKDEEAEKIQDLLFYKQYLLLNENKFAEAKKLIPEIRALLVPSKTNKLETSAIKKKKRTVEENERKIVHYKRVNPSRLYNFHYNTLITLLLCHDYTEAAIWLKRLSALYSKKANTRKDIQQLKRILQLVINYGLRSEEFSGDMFKRLYSSKSVRQSLTAFETVLYNFFKEMTNTPAYTERQQKHLNLLLQKLTALEEQEKKVLGYEDVILWIESQL